MLVVIASCFDETARDFVARCSSGGARVLTPRDLSRSGWQHSPRSDTPSLAVIDGVVVHSRDLAGILNCLPRVDESELDHIVEEDRSYVAAEMNAFLVSWLSALSCPQLNQPTADCLTGPGWRQEEWVLTASRLDIPVCAKHRHANFGTQTQDSTAASPVAVTVVGSHCFGEVDQELKVHARAIASAANIDLLAAHFTGPESTARFLGVSLHPDLSQEQIAGAVLDWFEERATC